MQASKKGLLPFKHGVPISQDQCPKAIENKDHIKAIVPYASTMGNLMYAMLYTELDIWWVYINPIWARSIGWQSSIYSSIFGA